MGSRPVIYASSLSRRQARMRRVRRRSWTLGPRLATLAASASACAFALMLFSRLV
jgi:hypothetical protein